jgi:signal transduction histidine kinase/HAMP domain-containing protein
VQQGEPFALVAAAQLLAVGAFLGLAAAFLRAPLRARGRLGTAVAIPGSIGAIALAVAAALVGIRLGHPTGSALLWLAVGGFAFVAVGLIARPPSRALSIAPLGAAVPPAALAVAAGVIAAASALRVRGNAGRVLAAALLLCGGAYALAPASDDHVAAGEVLLSMRLVGSALLLGVLVWLGRRSLLAKVFAVVGLGVLATAIATACVVGTVVADQLADDQTGQLRQAAVGTASDLQSDTVTAVQLAELIATCSPATTLTCAKGIAEIAPADAFTAVVSADGTVRAVGGPASLTSDPGLLRSLGTSAAVQYVRSGAPRELTPASGFVLLHGTRSSQLVAIGAARVQGAQSVVVYGEQVDTHLLVDAKSRSTFDTTVLGLPGGMPLASTLGVDSSAARGLATAARPLLPRLTDPGVAISKLGAGVAPVAAYVLLPSGTQRVAVLALSASSATVLSSQRTVLELLFIALLAITGVVALVAYVLGRRAVEPVRRLTTAARAVGAGDLTVRPQVGSVDEVGQLADVFGAMTENLQSLTGDLRITAATEAATRARLRTILDATPDALVVTDETGAIDLANPAAVALLGPLTGRFAAEALVGQDGRALPDGESVVVTSRGPVPVDVARASLPASRGTVYVLRDISAARQLEQAKTEFLSNVSHELRTPLTPIQGYADLLRRREDLTPAQTRAMADSIAGGARRLARAVGLLVDVAALDAGRVLTSGEPLVVGEVLDDRLEVWRERAPERAADLRRRVSAGVGEVLADPVWLGRALDELLDNALTYTEAGTPVTLLGTSGDDGRVHLAVRDAGPGLDEAAQAVLFADFEQVDGSATRSHDGLGLGLAFVRRVAAVLGARIWVVSGPGAGATFWLDLPAASAGRARRTARRRPATATVTPARHTARAGGGRSR